MEFADVFHDLRNLLSANNSQIVKSVQEAHAVDPKQNSEMDSNKPDGESSSGEDSHVLYGLMNIDRMKDDVAITLLSIIQKSDRVLSYAKESEYMRSDLKPNPSYFELDFSIYICLTGPKLTDEEKMKARRKLLVAPVMLLFFSGTMLISAVYTVTSNHSLGIVISELFDGFSKSANYSEARINVAKKPKLYLVQQTLDDLGQRMVEAVGETERLERDCLDSGVNTSCGNSIMLFWKALDDFNKSAYATPSELLALARQITKPLTAVQQLVDNLISLVNFTTAPLDIISKYKPQVEEYDAYSSACTAYWTALLGSVMFLVLFTVGANVHNACQRLEDVESLKGLVGAFSNDTNDYLRSLVNSSFLQSSDISSTSLFDAREIDTAIKAINMTDIVQKCKERKTVFTILNLSTSNLTGKLTSMFEQSAEVLTWYPIKAVNCFGDLLERPTDFRLERAYHSHNMRQSRSMENIWRQDQPSGIRSKHLFPEQGTGWPHFAKDEAEERRALLESRRLLSNARKLRRSSSGLNLSQILLDAKQCKDKYDELRACKEDDRQLSFIDDGKSCSANARVRYSNQLQGYVSTAAPIGEICAKSTFLTASKAKLLDNVLTYAERVNYAFENDILQCEVLTYFVRRVYNSTCIDTFHRINCWNLAIGLWCLLAIFAVCFSRSVCEMMLDTQPQKNRGGQ
ncbi:hypothetical protein M513_03752 [Trichuris suis]|uniref:Prominin n=1 Tax=Trichuris suis TaxID=68888 RepID=A0A085MDW6_9BILA|nr:hypothetical protein M513_03752 [Trichuris suis]